MFSTLLWWHWLVLAMLLLVVEIAAPVQWFLWVALAAGLTSLVVLVLPSLGWPLQLLVFGLLVVASLFVGRRLFEGRREPTDAPSLNRRGEQYVGRTFTLTEPIINGHGTVKVGDTRWRVSGPELAEGHPVRVTGVDGTTLRVEAAGPR